MFGTIDALRGVAAIAVVVLHGADLFRPFAAPGAYLAVDLFYMMSGFVLARAYEERFEAGLSAATFLRLRFVRLFPLYLLGTLIAIAGVSLALVVGAPVAWTWRSLALAAIPAIVMLPAPSTDTTVILYPLNSPAWSLLYELAINAVLALFWPWLTNRALIGIITVSFMGLLVVGIAYRGLDVGTTWATLLPGAIRVTFSFSVGVAVSHFVKRRCHRSRNVVAISCLALLLPVFTTTVPPAFRSHFDLVCVAGLFPALLWAAARVEPGPQFARVFAALGALSYPLYATHVPLMEIVRGALRRLATADPQSLSPIVGIVFLVAMIGFARLLNTTLDRPMRHRLAQAGMAAASGSSNPRMRS